MKRWLLCMRPPRRHSSISRQTTATGKRSSNNNTRLHPNIQRLCNYSGLMRARLVCSCTGACIQSQRTGTSGIGTTYAAVPVTRENPAARLPQQLNMVSVWPSRSVTSTTEYMVLTSHIPTSHRCSRPSSSTPSIGQTSPWNQAHGTLYPQQNTMPSSVSGAATSAGIGTL